ncbi:MAG: transposase [Gammaproteobacteria bacterium]|nr:transposase [Gammaproteobacteria bacterium]
MKRSVLRNDQWEVIKGLLPGKSTDCGVTAVNNRQFIEAVLWVARTGAPWRDLPEKFGYWHRVYVRYNQWSAKNLVERLFQKMKHFRRIATFIKESKKKTLGTTSAEPTFLSTK